MCVCERVFSVGFGPELDSMSPARSRRSASHAAGTHGWLPKKTGWPGLRRGGVGGYNLQSPRLWHTNHEQAVSVWCRSITSVMASQLKSQNPDPWRRLSTLPSCGRFGHSAPRQQQ